MKRLSEKRSAVLFMVCSASLAVCTSCIFDSQPAQPGYPSVLDATISFGSVGAPQLCKCMNQGGIALIAAGTNLAVADIEAGQNVQVIDIGVEIDDIADSDVGGYGYLVADSLMYAIDLGSASVGDPVRLGFSSEYISVSAEGDVAWVAGKDDSLGVVDLQTLEFSTVEDVTFSDCQGLASAENGNLFIADGGSSFITAWDTESWTEQGRLSLTGDVIDLFPGPSGYVCAIVEGSNELWFIRSSDCVLYKMITVPETPTAAACTSAGDYAYATCAGPGFLIVQDNGETVLRTMDYGLPCSIDLSPDGERAVVCSADNQAVYVLVK